MTIYISKNECFVFLKCLQFFFRFRAWIVIVFFELIYDFFRLIFFIDYQGKVKSNINVLIFRNLQNKSHEIKGY